MDAPERIVLVGLSGSGKTTIAHHLAQVMGWSVADSDDWIVAATGCTIPDLFARYGEPRFREIEHQAIRDLVGRRRLVLATGGGVVTRPENWPYLRQSSRVIWLRVRPESVVARLEAQQAQGVTALRPLLAGDAPLTRVRAMAEARQALYAQADLVIDVDDRAPETIAETILTALGRQP